MRRVQRTVTRVDQPRPPWTWRPCFRTGAPRTCLSSHRDPVYVRRGERAYKVGQRDWLLRLYQHVGITESSLFWDGHVLYEPGQEWALIRASIDWIEAIDNRRQRVFRISQKEAVQSAREVETPDGVRIAVPLAAYSVHEQE